MRKAAPPEIHVPKTPSGEPRYILVIALALIATVIFACQDAMTKTLVHNYPATFIVMIRYWVFFLAGAYMVKTASGGFIANIKSKRPFIQCLRGLLLLSELIAIALAFRVMGLAEATSIFQSYPLFGTVIAVFLLKEKVGWRRVLALVVGFFGILIMLRPGSGVLSVGAVWALIAAIFFALYMALTRLVGGIDKPQTSFFYVGLVGLVVMNIGQPFFWVRMESHYVWILVALCITSVVGHFLMIKALSIAPLTVVQPFNYLQLVWSVIIGYIVFGDMPDGLTLVGAALVVGSGLFVFFREQVKVAKIVVR
ncbi:DMT family transporter [uncultured Bartonella sp.]|uniref:DMT family transporter n=1 Tax=uncultured Bartonella sp. TaxID=104108 RepID=UPI002628E4E4|nr:DMT family transporter [uncultured Bartonella sp.]